MESEKTQKRKRDGDSPVERNSQRDGQEEVEDNIPRITSTIKRLHLEPKKLSGAARTRLLREKKKKSTGQANTETGSKQQPEQKASTSEGATGAGSGTFKEPETALERLLVLKSNLQRDPELYLRCLIEMRRRISRWPSSGKNTMRISLLRKTSKTFKMRYWGM